MDPLKPENVATENDPELDPWDDDEGAVRTIAMSAPEIDESVPSPISAPPPADEASAALGAVSLKALAAAAAEQAPSSAIEIDDSDLEEADIEEVEELDEEPPHRNTPSEARALRDKLRSVQGMAGSVAGPPRPGMGRSPSVPRAATALAAPLGFKSPAAQFAGPAPSAAANATKPSDGGAVVVDEDDEDGATRAAPREAFFGTHEVAAVPLQSTRPDEATRALPNGGLDAPDSALASPALPKLPADPSASPSAAGPGGVFAWGRGAPIPEPPPAAPSGAGSSLGFPAPPPSFSQHGSPKASGPGDFAHRTAMGSSPGVASHPGLPSHPGVASHPGLPSHPGGVSRPGVPAQLTRTGAWGTGQHPQLALAGQVPVQAGPTALQVMVCVAIGALSLIIFGIGVFLFVTTMF